MSSQSEKFDTGQRIRVNYIDYESGKETGYDVIGEGIFLMEEIGGEVLVFLDPTDEDPDGLFARVPLYTIEKIENS
jgi:hypothetical protein